MINSGRKRCFLLYCGKRGHNLKVVCIEHDVERYYRNRPWKLSLLVKYPAKVLSSEHFGYMADLETSDIVLECT